MAPFYLTNDHSGNNDKGREVVKNVEQVGKLSGITFREIPREKIYNVLGSAKYEKYESIRK